MGQTVPCNVKSPIFKRFPLRESKRDDKKDSGPNTNRRGLWKHMVGVLTLIERIFDRRHRGALILTSQARPDFHYMMCLYFVSDWVRSSGACIFIIRCTFLFLSSYICVCCEAIRFGRICTPFMLFFFYVIFSKKLINETWRTLKVHRLNSKKKEHA